MCRSIVGAEEEWMSLVYCSVFRGLCYVFQLTFYDIMNTLIFCAHGNVVACMFYEFHSG